MVYPIRINRRPDPRWTARFGGPSITPDHNGETLLAGSVEDRAALRGLLPNVRDLGVPLILAIRVTAGQASTSDVGQGTGRGHRTMATNERTNRPNPVSAHEEGKMDMKSRFSTLWTFAALNYLYCDVLGLMDPELLPQILRGRVNGIEFSPGFLLGAGILVEIPIAMVLLSRLLPDRANRWANIAAGTTMTAVQAASLFVGAPAPYYLFFSVIEIATTVLVVWFAWNWREPVAQSKRNGPELAASRL